MKFNSNGHRDAALIAARNSLEGYTFHCTCGESYKSQGAAFECRKCRTYLMPADYSAREVSYLSPSDAHLILVACEAEARRAI